MGTLVAVVLGLVRLTVKLLALPSAMLLLVTAATPGRSAASVMVPLPGRAGA